MIANVKLCDHTNQVNNLMNNASNLLIILPIIHASNMLNHDSNLATC